MLDGVVFSAPSFLEPIPGGSAQITGEFTIDEANDLANVLKFGSLPISLEVGQITSITPTVGDAYLHAGLLAGAIGLILVALYLLLYYRALGLVAAASLVVAGVITFCLFVIFGRTLGLHADPGRHRRCDRRHRHHRRLVHRVLRADPRRGARRAHPARGRRDRLDPRPAHPAGR